MSALVCGLGLWATMVLSARMMLAESILNFPLIIVMGVVLIAIFLVICGHFKSLLMEFETSFYFIEVVLFATIPLLSSVIVSWFLCVEIPTLNLPFCFTTCYFLYTIWLGAPRASSHPSSKTANSYEKTSVYALPSAVVKVVYAIPLIVSPVLHIALCHNVLMSSGKRYLAVTFLYPLLCMLMCAEQHIDYWGAEEARRILKLISDTKLAASALLFFFLQNHPILDDLKSLSGLTKPLASAFLCGAALLGSLTMYIHRYILIQSRDEMEKMNIDDTTEDMVKVLAGPYFASLITAGLTGECIVIFLGYNRSSFLLAFVGSIFITDFYRFSKNYKWNSMRSIVGTYLAILLTVIAVRFMLLDFLFRTVIYMTFSLDWAPNPMTMTAYCGRICDIFSLAVTAPTFAMGLNDHLADAKSDPKGLILPVGVPTPASHGSWSILFNRIKGLNFTLLFLIFTAALCMAELIIREQVLSIFSIFSFVCVIDVCSGDVPRDVIVYRSVG